MSRTPFLAGVGVVFDRHQPDDVVLGAPFRPDLTSDGATYHGGVVASVMDTAGAAAAWSDPDVTGGPGRPGPPVGPGRQRLQGLGPAMGHVSPACSHQPTTRDRDPAIAAWGHLRQGRPRRWVVRGRDQGPRPGPTRASTPGARSPGLRARPVPGPLLPPAQSRRPRHAEAVHPTASLPALPGPGGLGSPSGVSAHRRRQKGRGALAGVTAFSDPYETGAIPEFSEVVEAAGNRADQLSAFHHPAHHQRPPRGRNDRPRSVALMARGFTNEANVEAPASSSPRLWHHQPNPRQQGFPQSSATSTGDNTVWIALGITPWGEP